ncbi:MAG: hypothetical protein C0467_06030 [Planctomycetaceae bacterium]|nr:hypothetical protein [Planctomycetaceae bacterium]
MTARELLDELGRLGIRVVAKGGKPHLVPPKGSNLRDAVRRLEDDIITHRSELLELCGSDVWDQGWAIRRMIATDAAVEAGSVPGTHPDIQSAVEQVLACYAERDRGGLEEWCQVIEKICRERRRP